MESNLRNAFKYFRDRQLKETPLQKMMEMENKNKFLLEKEENTVFCSTNSPEVQEFLELSTLKVETDDIDIQKTTKSKWKELDNDGTI